MVGLGACPYAPGSKGNVATERVVELMKQLGYETNLDILKLHAVASYVRQQRL